MKTAFLIAALASGAHLVGCSAADPTTPPVTTAGASSHPGVEPDTIQQEPFGIDSCEPRGPQGGSNCTLSCGAWCPRGYTPMTALVQDGSCDQAFGGPMHCTCICM